MFLFHSKYPRTSAFIFIHLSVLSSHSLTSQGRWTSFIGLVLLEVCSCQKTNYSSLLSPTAFLGTELNKNEDSVRLRDFCYTVDILNLFFSFFSSFLFYHLIFYAFSLIVTGFFSAVMPARMSGRMAISSCCSCSSLVCLFCFFSPPGCHFNKSLLYCARMCQFFGKNKHLKGKKKLVSSLFQSHHMHLCVFFYNSLFSHFLLNWSDVEGIRLQ